MRNEQCKFYSPVQDRGGQPRPFGYCWAVKAAVDCKGYRKECEYPDSFVKREHVSDAIQRIVISYKK